MYIKIKVLLCVAGIVSAGNILQDATPVAYSSAPAVSHVSFTTDSAPAVTTYSAAPALSTYAAAAPIVANTLSRPVSHYSTYSPPVVSLYAATPIVTKGISARFATYPSAQTVSYQPVSAHSAPLAYAAAAPVIAKSYPAYSNYAAPVISSYHKAPLVAKSITPAITYSTVAAHSPLRSYGAAAPVYSAYSTMPSVKTAVTYSAAPVVAHVSFSSVDANYGW